MRLARRIRQARFEHLLSLEELAAQAGMSTTLLASIENGQEFPSREMIDRLAAAMGVCVASLFYDDLGPALTLWLTPRLSLQQLAEEAFRSRSFQSAFRLAFKGLREATAMIFSCITTDRRHLMSNPPPQRGPSMNSSEQSGGDSSARRKGS